MQQHFYVEKIVKLKCSKNSIVHNNQFVNSAVWKYVKRPAV